MKSRNPPKRNRPGPLRPDATVPPRVAPASTSNVLLAIEPSTRNTPEETVTLVQDDPTWELEYAHFKELCNGDYVTDLSNDIRINRMLRRLGRVAIADAKL